MRENESFRQYYEYHPVSELLSTWRVTVGRSYSVFTFLSLVVRGIISTFRNQSAHLTIIYGLAFSL